MVNCSFFKMPQLQPPATQEVISVQLPLIGPSQRQQTPSISMEMDYMFTHKSLQSQEGRAKGADDNKFLFLLYVHNSKMS